MTRLLRKNEHRKIMPYDEIDVRAHNVDSIEGFLVEHKLGVPMLII
jgi:hypothetical protein